MSDIFYRNFDMQILRAGEEYLAQTASADAGNASLNFTLPFSEDGLEALLSKLGPTRRVRGVETPIEAAKRLGGELYNAAFSAGIGSALDRGIETAMRENERLRIRLRLTNAPELANLPWEYLYDKRNDRFLALSYKTSIVRYLEIPQSVNPLAVKPPLRVLVMASSPIGYDALGVEKEWSNLQTALGKMPRGLVEVDRTEKATLEALQERLSGGDQYHIFHYIGHGSFDLRTGKSVLVMEDNHRQARFVDGPQLGVLLHNHPSLRLAILNACEGAVSNQNDVFTGVAQNLIKQEMPAVIAMQFEITDSVAIILAKAFYESLARSAPVDKALMDARLAIFAADYDGIEWGTPVLYLRSDDGRLFDIEGVEPQSAPKSQRESSSGASSQTPEQKKSENLPPSEHSKTLSGSVTPEKAEKSTVDPTVQDPGTTSRRTLIGVIITAVLAAVATITAAIINKYPNAPQPGPSSQTFIGRISDKNTEEKVRRAKVSLEGEGVPSVTYSDSEGIFSFPVNDPNKEIHLRIEAEQYKNFDLRVTPAKNQGIQDIHLTLKTIETPDLSGIVLDSNDSPIQGAKVTLDDVLVMRSVETDSHGQFTLKEVPRKYGEMVRVRVVKEGYEPHIEDVVLGKTPPRIKLKR